MSTDLLDLLAAEDAADVIHMILPSFAAACGRDYLELLRIGQVKGRRLHTLTSTQTTCPECLAVGEKHGGLPALCQRISNNQAPTET